MNRRQFLVWSGASLAFGPAMVRAESGPDLQVAPLDIEDALAMLDQLQHRSVQKSGAWNLFQVYTHLAQSVEYSISGYPEHKSWLFKHTVGSLAFSVFSAKGSMHHGLDEEIPGAPPLQVQGDVDLALQRLRDALLAFRDHSGPLQPHFAYGELSKDEYTQAHVMHLNNHLEEFSVG